MSDRGTKAVNRVISINDIQNITTFLKMVSQIQWLKDACTCVRHVYKVDPLTGIAFVNPIKVLNYLVSDSN